MKLSFNVQKFTKRLAMAGLMLATLGNGIALSQGWVARHGMTSAQYQAEFNKYTSKDYRLTDVSGFAVGGTPYYAAIWVKRAGSPGMARHGMSASGYQTAFNKYTGQGMTPMMVDAFGRNGQGNFAAIWAQSRGAWVARHGLSSSAYQAEFNKWTAKGYRLVDVSGYEQNGKARYAAIWKKRGSGAWVARHGMTSAQYQAAFNKYTAQGYVPTHVDGYSVAGKTYYAAIWTKKSVGYVARHGMTSAKYQAEFNKWTAKGYRLVDVSGYNSGGSARYAAIWYK